MTASETQTCPNCGLPIGDEPGPGDLPCDVCGQGMGMNWAPLTLWGPGDIIAALGVKRVTFKRWRDSGKFPEPYAEPSNGPVWLAEDVKRWDDGRKR